MPYKDPEKRRVAARERMRRWREKNPERNQQIAAEQREKHKEHRKEYKQIYDQTHKHVKKAWNAACYAHKTGKLFKTPCSICNNSNSQKHHPDYSKPLMVIWLCASCHKKIHLGESNGKAR